MFYPADRDSCFMRCLVQDVKDEKISRLQPEGWLESMCYISTPESFRKAQPRRTSDSVLISTQLIDRGKSRSAVPDFSEIMQSVVKPYKSRMNLFVILLVAWVKKRCLPMARGLRPVLITSASHTLSLS
jgi:hypothetical protein